MLACKHDMLKNMNKMNKAELRRLLTITNPERETIFGVIGRMEILLDMFQKEQTTRSFLPFLKTYYFVTKAAAEKYIQKKHFFLNIREYEILDIYFASLYFKPLHAFLVENKYNVPWQTYFIYCNKKAGIPFLQMLLGINAHINANLYTALVDLKYKNQRDFFLVNDILQEVFPEVIHFMAFTEHDIFSAGGLILKKLYLSEFHTVIEKWRSEAWANAYVRQTKHDSKGKSEYSYSHIAHKTEEIGKKLIYDFETLSILPTLPEVIHNLKAPTLMNKNMR